MSNFQSLRATRTARQKSSVQNNARIVHEEAIGPGTNVSKSPDRQTIEQVSSSRENSCVRNDKDDQVLEEDTQESGSMSTIAPTAPTTTTETTKAKQVSGTKSKLTKLYEKELSGVGIEVRDIPGRGRGLVSTKSFKPGQSVYPLTTPHYLAHCVKRNMMTNV